jgi:molecular chaperone DnaK (HSP70)
MRAAVIVGCGKFDDPEIVNLEFAGQDADRFAGVAEGIFGVPKQTLNVLADDRLGGHDLPTRARLLSSLGRGQRNLRGQRVDILYFYFSGHGFRSSEDNEDYLVLKDTALNAIRDTALGFNTLLRYLREWNAKHTILFIDACRSNVEKHKSPVDGDTLPVDIPALCPPGMVTFCSCSPGEKSFEAAECKGGLFTQALIESFGPAGKCGTVYEIDQFLLRSLPELGQRFSKPIQNPYTKLEPIGIQNLAVVRDQLAQEWRGLLPFKGELRVPYQPTVIGGLHEMMAIDFGTGNSLAAVASKDVGVKIVPNPEGGGVVPSVVNFRPDFHYLVGRRAVSQLPIDPENTIGYTKRLLGTGNGFSINGRSVFPEDVAYLIIKSLKTNAEEISGFPFNQVLASIPINFSAAQERGLVTALQRAGFSQIRFIPEPCAAALMTLELASAVADTARSVLVIDLGAGTLDIAAILVADVASERGAIIEVVGVEGNPRLGGLDYDNAIAAALTEKLSTTSFSSKDVSKDVLRAEAERVKILLSKQEVAPVFLGTTDVEGSEPQDIVFTVTREAIARACSKLDDQIVELILSILTKGPLRSDSGDWHLGLRWPEVIMLAGQGTKFFSLMDRIQKLFPGILLVDRYQDTAVIRGLGAYLRTLNPAEAMRERPLLLNVMGRALGVMHRGEAKEKDGKIYLEVGGAAELNNLTREFIESDDVIPTKRSVRLLFSAGSELMCLNLTEKFGGMSASLGTIILRRASNSVEAVEITADIDANFTISLEIAKLGDSAKQAFQLNNYFLEPSKYSVSDRQIPIEHITIETDFRVLKEDE